MLQTRPILPAELAVEEQALEEMRSVLRESAFVHGFPEPQSEREELARRSLLNARCLSKLSIRSLETLLQETREQDAPWLSMQVHQFLSYAWDAAGDGARAQDHHLRYMELVRGISSASLQSLQDAPMSGHDGESEGAPLPGGLESRWFTSDDRSFLRSLARRAPSLTPTELQISLFLRENRSSKEIAYTLSLSSGTVDLYRSRIRKKLQLGPHQNLIQVLTSEEWADQAMQA